MRGVLIGLIALVRKELLQTLRDRGVLFMLLVAPIVQLVGLGYAANMEFLHAATVLVDQDRSPESRALCRALAADDTFVVRDVETVDEAERALREGAAQVAVIVPQAFGRELVAGRPTSVQVLIDGSDPTRGVQAGAAIEGFTAEQAARAHVRWPVGVSGVSGVSALPRVGLVPRLLYNPRLASRIFIVPGTAASILLVVSTIVTAVGLSREREMGTLEQLLVTPLSPLVLMIGKTIPYAVFGLVDATIILVLGNVLFDVPLRGPIDVVFVGTTLYLVATLSIGLLISTAAKTQQQAFMAGLFFVLPALLLSGFLTPVSAMPWWIRPVTYVTPTRWYVELVRTVLLRGGGYRDVATQLGALAALSTVVLTVATLRFRRTVG